MKKVWVLLTGLLALAAIGLTVIFAVSKDRAVDYSGPVMGVGCVFRLDDGKGECVNLIVLDTQESRVRGLSGVEFLPETEGRLFDFYTPSRYCIWMKDMNFDLDIVWVNEAKQVIDIKEGISPESYPQKFCNESQPSRYVIEVNGGVADRAGLRIGSQMNF